MEEVGAEGRGEIDGAIGLKLTLGRKATEFRFEIEEAVTIYMLIIHKTNLKCETAFYNYVFLLIKSQCDDVMKNCFQQVFFNTSHRILSNHADKQRLKLLLSKL